MTNLQSPLAHTKSETQLTSEATAIIFFLESKLIRNDEVIAMGIMNCIKDGTPATQIIREIAEMARDNYTDTETLVGSTLLLSITNFNCNV